MLNIALQQFLPSVRGGKTSLRGGKITEWWLEPTTLINVGKILLLCSKNHASMLPSPDYYAVSYIL